MIIQIHLYNLIFIVAIIYCFVTIAYHRNSLKRWLLSAVTFAEYQIGNGHG